MFASLTRSELRELDRIMFRAYRKVDWQEPNHVTAGVKSDVGTALADVATEILGR